jgi:hypothetical protein
MSARVWTIGHSNHDWPRFEKLLEAADITAVADIRSSPHSRHAHFGRVALRAKLTASGVAYVFLGRELGGRRPGGDLVDYEQMAKSPVFLDGLARVEEIASRSRLALMCSESEPLACHRFLLVARRLAERGVEVAHILRDGRIEPQAETEQRLLKLTGLTEADLLASRAERLDGAYRAQNLRLAGRARERPPEHPRIGRHSWLHRTNLPIASRRAPAAASLSPPTSARAHEDLGKAGMGRRFFGHSPQS